MKRGGATSSKRHWLNGYAVCRLPLAIRATATLHPDSLEYNSNMANHAWILQVKGNGPKQQFRLEAALSEALQRDRTLWLAPLKTVRFDGPEHPVGGDRVYLNVSGEKAKGSNRSGMLVAIATALDKPVSQPMPEWQEKYLSPVGYKSYKADDERVHLRIDARIDPVLGKQEVYNREQAVQDWPCFYQLRNGMNVARGTTFFVAKALDDLLFTLCQDRLADILPASLTMLNQTPLSEEDARRRVFRELNERSGQGTFRQAPLRESEACAFTGTLVIVREVLEAAHIMPYRGKHTNDPDNGLLLRADVHKLFDRGLVRIDPVNGQLQIDAALDGSVYKDLDGKPVCNWQRLRQDALNWRWANPDLLAWARG